AGADLTWGVRLHRVGPNVTVWAGWATTALPRLSSAPSVTVTDGSTIKVTLPDAPTPVSREALLQLTCTVRYAAAPFPRPSGQDSTPRLQVTGASWTMSSYTTSCPAKPSVEAGGPFHGGGGGGG
ncbi:hypothetical protein ACFTY7_45730, partial [Streptomyces sp. NPDC057062]